MSGTGAIDQFLEHNADYVASFTAGGLGAPPSTKVAVLTCMDARIDPARMLGLSEGDVHVIRNAGGVVTDDALRSLTISQRLLGTEEIMVVHHTKCGMEAVRDDELAAELEAETGQRPPFAFGGFKSAEADVAETVARLRASPFLPNKRIRGFLYEVESGRLRELPVG